MHTQQYPAVNRKNGMQITQFHFVAQDNANRCLSAHRAANLLHGNNYWLLSQFNNYINPILCNKY